jgi:hypothetical protein
VVLKLRKSARATLDLLARARGQSPASLAAEIVATVVEEGLVAAILW